MKKTLVLTALSGILSMATLSADWMTIGLQDRLSYENVAMTHLDDGRLVYGHDGTLYQQSSFGSVSFNAYDNNPAVSYSYITGNGFIGSGAFGGGPIYSFDATATNSSFDVQNANRQNYAAVAYGTGILISGQNGASTSPSEIGYVDVNGVYTPIVSEVSTNSGGLTLDADGNLYVADNDDSKIYSFTAAQVAAAVGGSTLAMTDGLFVANLGVSGSLAVDSLGRLYATGYQKAGIQVFDLLTLEANSILPGANDSNYGVTTFSDGENDYVGWLHWAGYAAGDAVTYGYDLDGNVAVPEPSTYAFLAGFICLGLTVIRRRR